MTIAPNKYIKIKKYSLENRLIKSPSYGKKWKIRFQVGVRIKPRSSRVAAKCINHVTMTQ
jgi:hypothetical protein